MKKLYLLLTVSALLVALTACGSDNKDSENAATTTEQNQTQAQTNGNAGNNAGGNGAVEIMPFVEG